MNAPEPRARTIDLAGSCGQMAVLDFGPPDRPVDIVFSHANGFNARTYRTILAPLTHLRIIAPDLRGHGRSTLPAVAEDRVGWTEFRDDLLALLETVAEGPVILAGHSLGATVSLLATALRPDRVRAMALFEPVFLPRIVLDRGAPSMAPHMEEGALRRRATYPDRETALAAYLGRGAFRTWRQEQLADYVADGFVDTPDGAVTLACTPAWEASTYRTHNYDPWAALAAVGCPIRLLRGTEESAVYGEVGADLAVKSNMAVETIPGASHFLPMERPDLVRATLLDLAG